MRPIRRSLAAFAVLVLGAAPVLRAQVVSEVQVEPEQVTLRVGERQGLFAAAFDGRGSLIPGARFTFSGGDTGVIQVLSDGTIVGVRPGLAVVEVRAGQGRATVPVSVTGDPSRAQAIVPAAAASELAPAKPVASVPATAPAADPVQPDAAPAGVVAPVDFWLSSGRLLLSPGELDTVRAFVPSQGGRTLEGGLQWRSTDPAVARVGPTGIVQALAPGEAEIVVSGFRQERRLRVSVHRPIARLVVSPRPGTEAIRVPLLGSRTITARAEAADASPVPDAPFRWEVGDTSLVRFDAATGTLTGLRLGTTSLSLRLTGFDLTSWVVEVVPGALGLSPDRIALAPGGRASITPALLDDAGRVVAPAAEVRWSSSRPDVASVSGGSVQARTLGRATVTATNAWGGVANAEVYVLGDLLLSSNRQGRGMGIFQLRVEAPSGFIPVLADGAVNLDPVWSPDRTRIAFSSDRSGDFELYVMDADGRNVRRLTESPGADGDPAWSPDGRGLFFTSERTGTRQIHYVDVATGETGALTSAPGGSHAPVVSPDGRTVAFLSARDGNQDVFLMDLGGGSQRNLTWTAEREGPPRFLPDGDLLYAVERPGKEGSLLIRHAQASGARATLAATDRPITGLAVSRDGERIAYVLGGPADGVRGRGRSGPVAFHLRRLASGAAPVEVRLVAGERVASPSF